MADLKLEALILEAARTRAEMRRLHKEWLEGKCTEQTYAVAYLAATRAVDALLDYQAKDDTK